MIELDACNPLSKLEKDIVKDCNYIQDEITSLKEAIKGIDIINSVQDDDEHIRSKRSTEKYNRRKAILYSMDHAKIDTYNSKVYGKFKEQGGDCTNFVSQCLAKGGDVLQLKFLMESRCGHSILVDGIPNNDDIYYCGHTKDVKSGSFKKNILEKFQYTKVRLIRIIY